MNRFREALIYWLRGRIAASCGARKLAYRHDMSRLTSHLATCRLVEWPCRALCAGLLALHPARRINQRLLRHLFARSLLLAGLCGLVPAGAAGSTLPLAPAGGLSQLERLPLTRLLQHPQPAGGGTLRAPQAKPVMPQRLAQSLPIPVAQQREVEQVYEQMLSLYRRAMRHGELPDDDIGIALGAFIVANYQIASDSTVDDEASKATYLQMQRLAGNDPALQKLDAGSRQALFEELAIMAMTMETIYEQAWDRGDRNALERAQPAARQYLQAVLQRPYGALRFDAQGLSLADR